MVKSPRERYTETPLKHRASNIDHGQGGRIIAQFIAQGITRSTATIQGCVISDSDTAQVPLIWVQDAEKPVTDRDRNLCGVIKMSFRIEERIAGFFWRLYCPLLAFVEKR
jgi:hypothetical protein